MRKEGDGEKRERREEVKGKWRIVFVVDILLSPCIQQVAKEVEERERAAKAAAKQPRNPSPTSPASRVITVAESTSSVTTDITDQRGEQEACTLNVHPDQGRTLSMQDPPVDGERDVDSQSTSGLSESSDSLTNVS